MNRYENQVVIITGGAQGIGLGIAERMGSEGASVALMDRDQAKLDEAEKALAGKGIAVLALATDVTDPAAVNKGVAETMARFGRIDVLVTAAGMTGKTSIKTHEVDQADFEQVMNLNLTAMFLCIKAVLPHMLKADYGRIVNIASISGKDGNAGMLAYSSSKSARKPGCGSPVKP